MQKHGEAGERGEVAVRKRRGERAGRRTDGMAGDSIDKTLQLGHPSFPFHYCDISGRQPGDDPSGVAFLQRLLQLDERSPGTFNHKGPGPILGDVSSGRHPDGAAQRTGFVVLWRSDCDAEEPSLAGHRLTIYHVANEIVHRRHEAAAGSTVATAFKWDSEGYEGIAAGKAGARYTRAVCMVGFIPKSARRAATAEEWCHRFNNEDCSACRRPV